MLIRCEGAAAELERIVAATKVSSSKNHMTEKEMK